MAMKSISSLKYSLFVKIFKHVSYWNVFPFAWNSLTNSAEVNFKITRATLKYKRNYLYVVATCLILQIAGGFAATEKSNITIIDKVRNGIVLICFLIVSTHFYSILSNTSEIILYTNGLMDFINKHLRWRTHDNNGLIEQLNIVFACGTWFTSVLLPPAIVFVFHWSNPCKVSLFGYWVIPECNGVISAWANFPIKCLVFVLGNQVPFSIGMQAPVFAVAMLQCLGTMIFLDCQKIYWAKLNGERSQDGMRNTCLLYRELQTLANLNNVIHQKIVTTSMLVAGIILHAFCFTAAILTLRNSHLISYNQFILQISFFGIYAFNALLYIMVFLGGLSQLHKESMKLFRGIKLYRYELIKLCFPRHIRSWQAKFFRSCSALKVKFGSNNYVEELTPLNALNLSLALVIQLLIIQM